MDPGTTPRQRAFFLLAFCKWLAWTELLLPSGLSRGRGRRWAAVPTPPVTRGDGRLGKGTGAQFQTPGQQQVSRKKGHQSLDWGVVKRVRWRPRKLPESPGWPCGCEPFSVAKTGDLPELCCPKSQPPHLGPANSDPTRQSLTPVPARPRIRGEPPEAWLEALPGTPGLCFHFRQLTVCSPLADL